MSTTPTQVQVYAAQVAQARAARRLVGAITEDDEMMKRSPDSAHMLEYWDKVDAILEGVDGMKLHQERFMPRFADEGDTEYLARLNMAKMTNVYIDIIEGLASKPFEEPVMLVKGEDGEEIAPQQIEDFVQDVDGSGNTLTVFASEVFFHAINNAIHWIFVDYSNPKEPVRNMADVKRVGVRPYWSHVRARNVLDVQSEVINSKEVLTYFKIFEPGTPDRIREFVREPDGRVTWALYERTEKRTETGKTAFVAIESGEITIGMIPMIPLITGRRIGRSWKILPPMKAAVEAQVELYQSESALKFAKALTAYPMLAANGITPAKGADGKPLKLAVGPNRVLYSSPDSSTGKVGNWSYVEPGSESLKFLAENIKDDIQNLRELGKQPLSAQSGNITVITAAVAAGKARSAVKAWAYKLKDSLENALVATGLWFNITYDAIIHVFVDFDEYLEGQDAEALGAARERGDLSQETYWEELRRRTYLSSNFTPERERKRLLEEQPGGEIADG